MVWVWVFLGIAVAGLGMLVGYAGWLAHLTADLLSEVAVLGRRAGELLDLLGRVGAVDEPVPVLQDEPTPGARRRSSG